MQKSQAKSQAVLGAIMIPFLVLIGSVFLWSGLNAIGFFNAAKGTLAFLGLPFCVYGAAIVVWIVNPMRWEIVPAVVAVSTTVSFLLGAALLMNSVGLGLNPIPVFDIFFTSRGLNRTLPYFLDHSDALNSNQTIFRLLVSPAIAALAGFFLSCLIRREKPSEWRDRLKWGGIRFGAVTLAFVAFVLGAR